MDKDECIDIIKSAVNNGSHPPAPDAGLFKPTSVMALLVFNGQIELVFIQKADIAGYPWRNQMAFPGGHREETDRSSEDTALRELSEEMGIRRDNVDIIGSLGHFQTINSRDIEAWIGVWNNKDKIEYDPNEISRVFQIPLKYLVDLHKKQKYHLHKPDIMLLTYPYEDVTIWGATAKILYHLIEVLLKNT